jgi:hypothetical protein
MIHLENESSFIKIGPLESCSAAPAGPEHVSTTLCNIRRAIPSVVVMLLSTNKYRVKSPYLPKMCPQPVASSSQQGIYPIRKVDGVPLVSFPLGRVLCTGGPCTHRCCSIVATAQLRQRRCRHRKRFSQDPADMDTAPAAAVVATPRAIQRKERLNTIPAVSIVVPPPNLKLRNTIDRNERLYVYISV